MATWVNAALKMQRTSASPDAAWAPLLYTGTMSAVVLGGASTVGGVGLGYTYGLSGMWLVVAIAAGVVILSLIFAPIISKLKIYTVSQMLSLRYGVRAT